MNAGLTTIRMELRLEGDLPTGRVSDDSGRVRSFDGWLGLVAAIDELVSDQGREEPSGGS